MKRTTNIGRLMTFMAAIVLGTSSLFAQVPAKTEACQPKEMIEKLWQNTVNLNPLTRRWGQSSGLFLHPPSTPPHNRVIEVISNDWKVTSCTIHGNTAEVTVDFHSAGQLNAVLHLDSQQAGGFMEAKKQYHLVLAPTHWHNYKSDGKNLVPSKEMTGPAAWQIEDADDSHRTTVNTAIRYLLEARRKKSITPAAKANAERSIAELMRTKVLPTTAIRGKPEEQVVNRLWDMATNGELLSEEGWQSASVLVTRPAPFSKNGAIQVMSNDWAVYMGGKKDKGADVVADYWDSGQVDSKLRYTPPKPSKFFKMGLSFSVVPAPAEQAQSRPDKEAQASEWLIDGSQGLFPNLRWTTINTAIRYVLEMRSKTSDPVIKQNADRTLAILLRYE